MSLRITIGSRRFFADGTKLRWGPVGSYDWFEIGRYGVPAKITALRQQKDELAISTEDGSEWLLHDPTGDPGSFRVELIHIA